MSVDISHATHEGECGSQPYQITVDDPLHSLICNSQILLYDRRPNGNDRHIDERHTGRKDHGG